MGLRKVGIDRYCPVDVLGLSYVLCIISTAFLTYTRPIDVRVGWHG